jgi:O-antigen ligase
VFLSFYILDGRLTSQDITTRWRLDIWQDVIEDMFQDKLVIKGYGYNEIIPAMIDPNEPGRTGRDGTNENLHNYFVNIFARGGIFQLILFLIFFYLIIYLFKESSKKSRISALIICALMTSSFDPSMESVQFPFIFYFFLGYLINQN